MKIILDTNVIVSGIFFSGAPYTILNAWRHQKFNLVISPGIYQEYENISRDLQHHYPNVNIDHFLALILSNSEMCHPDKLNYSVTHDPKDEMFIACAIASNTKIIISGDKHLLSVSGYNDIEVLSPRRFVEKHL